MNLREAIKKVINDEEYELFDGIDIDTLSYFFYDLEDVFDIGFTIVKRGDYGDAWLQAECYIAELNYIVIIDYDIDVDYDNITDMMLQITSVQDKIDALKNKLKGVK